MEFPFQGGREGDLFFLKRYFTITYSIYEYDHNYEND